MLRAALFARYIPARVQLNGTIHHVAFRRFSRLNFDKYFRVIRKRSPEVDCFPLEWNRWLIQRDKRVPSSRKEFLPEFHSRMIFHCNYLWTRRLCKRFEVSSLDVNSKEGIIIGILYALLSFTNYNWRVTMW